MHERVDGYSVGQHLLVTRLLKGVFNERPPLPRYTSTCNVQSVLSHISAWVPNGSLSLTQLEDSNVVSIDTAIYRSADLSQLNLTRKRYKPDGIVFIPDSWAKQGKPVSEFFFLSFSWT